MSENKVFGKLDPKIFYTSLAVVAVFVGWTLITPNTVQSVFDAILSWCLERLGWYFLLSLFGYLAFCFILAFSRFGKMKLGKDDDEPEYSTASWIAMTFSAGMGIGLVFWSVAEPMMHFGTSPLAESGTQEAAQVAMHYTFFHWGLHPWSIYAIIALPIAYFSFRKDLPVLVSSALYPILGDKGARGPWAKAVDILAVLVTLFGVANSLGLGAMQINSGLNFLMDVPISSGVAIMVIGVVTTLFIISAVSGIDRGIKWLSNTNMIIATILMASVFFMGPTQYLIDLFVETIGHYLQNIIGMSFFLDTQGTVAEATGYEWVQSWTVFYWVWWIMYGPFSGIFFARVSKGRTIKEFVLGVMVAPVILSFIWLNIFGGTALFTDLFGGGGIAEAVSTNMESAIFVTLGNLPLTEILSILVIIMIGIFYITSADSATFVVGMLCAGGELNPSTRLKVVLGVVEGSIAAMLLLAGGLSAVQTVSFIFGTPFTIVMILMAYCLVREMRKEMLEEDKKIVKKIKKEEAVS